MNNIKNELETVRELLEDSQEPSFIGEVPYVIVEQGHQVISLEQHLANPTRTRGAVTLQREKSFWRYVNEHATEASRIYHHGRSFTCIFDHSAKAAPGWGQHRAIFTLQPSPEWTFWTHNDKRRYTQEEFAAVIEDNMLDITTPSGGAVLDMVSRLEAKTEVLFKSFIRTDGCQSLTYEETTVAKAGQRGTMELPKQFILTIPAFVGGEKKEVVAKLSFKITEGKLALWYQLQQATRIVEEVLDRVVSGIATATNIEVFFGTPADINR